MAHNRELTVNHHLFDIQFSNTIPAETQLQLIIEIITKSIEGKELIITDRNLSEDGIHVIKVQEKDTVEHE
jgi:hypothetical protein